MRREIMDPIFGFLLLLVLSFTSSSQTLRPFEYNITRYTRNLPEEIKPTVRAALKAERKAVQRSQKIDACDVDGRAAQDCPPAKYRRVTGECNNIRHPTWGGRGAPFLRLVAPDYADGKFRPRTSKGTHALPGVLDVAATFQTVRQKQHESVTALLGAWSELLLHDIASTGNLRSEDCCAEDAELRHGECFGKIGHNECRDYMRTLPALDVENGCAFRFREQMNLVSSFLDGSAVYGNTENAMEKLRTYDLGLVNISACVSCENNALYSALLKEHNRIAVNLAQLNKHWDDEVLFLESRRILAAEIQHITYREFLPIVLGEESVVNSELQLQTHGHYSKYSSSHKAGVYNSVAMVALPALLSMIPNSFMNQTAENFAEMIDILISTSAQEPSMHLAVTLRSDWDTASLFLHMGRDHGLPGYTTFLRHCQNSTDFQSFEDLNKILQNPEFVKALQYHYSDVNDVDALLGVLLERPLPGAIVGPTLRCLLQEQFTLLRRSDRFWYENDLPPSSLTAEQLKEIRKVTLGAILCVNTEDLDRIQPNAFVKVDPFLNAPITCEQHPLPDLMPWLEMDHMADLSEEVLMDAISKAEQDVLERRKMEYEAWRRLGGIDPKSPQGTAASFSKANKQALKLANSSHLFELASSEIINSLMNRRRKRQLFDNNVLPTIFRDELSEGLQNVDISSLIPSNVFDHEPDCEDSGPCDAQSPFRTYTGHCNNLRNPSWGKSLTTFARLLPSVYEDGVSHPRSKSVTGVPLPSPRIISTVIHPDISNLHSRYSLVTMQYAQFLDHDLTMTPIHKGFHESIPDCRSCDSPRTVHPECNPFPVPPGDHYYPEINITSGQRMCFPFMRSLPGQQSLGPREQVNQNTAFLDASQVYGENRCVLKILKGSSGLMNFTLHPVRGKHLLPQSDHHPECKAASGQCFIAGDGRASEQPGLTAIHTVFMREHNRLADGLRALNPHWDEERVFEHARRIVIAEVQHLTYNEFLPRLLGWNAVNLYGLKLLPQGYYTEYSPSCNPSIINEFAAAAFRIGHSLLRPHIPRLSPSYEILDPPILLRDGFFKTDMFYQPGMVDEIMRGLVSTPMETLDQFITGEVTNHLFEDRRIPFSGVDLIALNIQRARDHGVPSYNNFRALCNLKRATSFDDLAREIPQEVIVRLKRIYPTVDDIDLFPGGMSERPLQGGLVGPTFACIIAIQFRQLRKCDRFWYENEDSSVRFTEPQLQEIRKITMAKVICDNMEQEQEMQRAAFDLPSNFLNPRVPCRSMPGIHLSAWREHSSNGCIIGDKHIAVGESAFPSPCTSCVCSNEGPRCASLRVTDCSQLMREWPKEAILRDDVCTAQCGFRVQTRGVHPQQVARGSSVSVDLVPPPARHPRVLRTPTRSFQTTSPFTGFEFPDLTPYIAK